MRELEILRQAHKCGKIAEINRSIDRYRRPVVDVAVDEKLFNQDT
jgi:hypothetical protein